MNQKILLLITLTFFYTPAYALQPQGFNFCTHHNFQVTPLKINLYDIYLCNDKTPKPFYQNIWGEQFALVIDYNKNISKQRLVDASIEQIKKHNQIDEVEAQNIVKKLSEIFPEVKKGDQISALYFKGLVTLEHNQKRIGIISDATFAKQFVNIWLSPQNDFKKMRLDLLNYEK